ncbi:MAG: hypothetical protein Hyperionvirus27_29 [Hyperionvirus sp.]|uniref:Uncharacterized protein n=1 Tax=Hyperionvirus sp. TaxID=2487770 RepID=A0A3G5AGI5_9VIRU|nr:MAG: hypothetical protein Hyperionvirus27_29 [Hyperionvirus sp.]
MYRWGQRRGFAAYVLRIKWNLQMGLLDGGEQSRTMQSLAGPDTDFNL